MAQNPKQRIARTSEGINYHDLIRWHPSGDRRNIEANTVAKRVTRTLYRGAAEETYAQAIPLLGRHSVDADVVGVGEAIETVLLNLRKAQHLIALGAMQ